LQLTIFILSICHSMNILDHKRKRKPSENTKNAWPEEIYEGMTGILEYEDDPLKFRVIEIKGKNDGKRNFKHKVTYPDDDDRYVDEFLFLDLKNRKYYAKGHSGAIFDIFPVNSDEPESKKKKNTHKKNSTKEMILSPNKMPKEVHKGMTGTLDYDGPLKFKVIRIYNDRDKTNERKKNDKTNIFKHKVTYLGENKYPDEWLFLDLKQRRYKAEPADDTYSGKILEIEGVWIETDEPQNEVINSKKNTLKKKIGKNVNEKNWNFKNWDIVDDDIASLSTDVTNDLLNSKDVVVGMTGCLEDDRGDQVKELDFIVVAIDDEKTDEKHFIMFPGKDDEYEPEWLDLDLKNSIYGYKTKSYNKIGWYEGKIWNLKFPNGEADNYLPQEHKRLHASDERLHISNAGLFFPSKFKNLYGDIENICQGFYLSSQLNTYMCKNLEKNCIDIKNVNTLMGQRLLREAVLEDSLNLVQLLCTKGADKNQSTKTSSEDLDMMFCLGDTPLDIALNNNFRLIAKYLIKNNYYRQKYELSDSEDYMKKFKK